MTLDPGAVNRGIVAIFVTVYVGMFLAASAPLSRAGWRRCHGGCTGLLAVLMALTGNLLLVGSIANLIVVDLARRSGVVIDWKDHARIGLPITLATLGIVWVWLRWGM